MLKNLLRTIYYMPSVIWMIAHTSLASKKPISTILKTMRSWFSYLFEIFTSFYNVNVKITLIFYTFQDEHLLDGSNLGLHDYPYIILIQIIKMWISNLIQ